MAFSDQRIHLAVDSSGARAIDEYLEYRRIVGDDDGGTLFTPEQYEEYKKKVFPMRMENRIYTCWASISSGIECKIIGPETICFCQHRYNQHTTDFEVIPKKRPIHLPCEVRGCGCKSYSYIPLNGSQPIRCTSCKHFSDEHSVTFQKKCKKTSCSCSKFYSAYTCGCGEPCYNHKMIIETKEERQGRGKPVGRDVLYKAMGGLTGFSSLAHGYMRLDNSGIGAPPREFLEQPVSAFDHPFLKMHCNMKELSVNNNNITVSKRSKEDDDMAYYERRYQQRLKEERQAARLKNNPKASIASKGASKPSSTRSKAIGGKSCNSDGETGSRKVRPK